MEASDYKGLKSKTIDNNKLEDSWTTNPTMTRAMHAGQHRVFKSGQVSTFTAYLDCSRLSVVGDERKLGRARETTRE